MRFPEILHAFYYFAGQLCFKRLTYDLKSNEMEVTWFRFPSELLF